MQWRVHSKIWDMWSVASEVLEKVLASFPVLADLSEWEGIMFWTCEGAIPLLVL